MGARHFHVCGKGEKEKYCPRIPRSEIQLGEGIPNIEFPMGYRIGGCLQGPADARCPEIEPIPAEFI